MVNSLFRSISLVSSATLISRVVGFVRDILWASLFGADAGFDAFLVAFKIPNFMRRLFAEGAFSQAFVPVLSEHYANKSSEKTLIFIDKIFSLLSLVLLCVVIFAYFTAPYIITIFAPGYLDNMPQFNLTVTMLRITFPYLLFISIVALLGAVYNCRDRFFLPSLCPVILNISTISIAIYGIFYGHSFIHLSWAVVAAGFLQMSLLFWGMFKWQRLPRFTLRFNDIGVFKVVKLMSAALFGVSVSQISFMIETFLASFLPAGSMSWLYYSERLVNLPIGLFAIAISTVVLPSLSSHYASSNMGEFRSKLSWSLRLMLILALPASVGLFLLAKPILITLFLRGKFSFIDITNTSNSLQCLSLGLPAFMLVKVLVASFYARQDIKTPVKIAFYSLLVDVILSVSLLNTYAHVGLSFAVSAAAWVNALSLLYVLVQKNIFSFDSDFTRSCGISLCGLICMSITIGFFSPSVDIWLSYSSLQRFMQLFVCLATSITGYILVLRLFGMTLDSIKYTSPPLQKTNQP